MPSETAASLGQVRAASLSLPPPRRNQMMTAAAAKKAMALNSAVQRERHRIGRFADYTTSRPRVANMAPAVVECPSRVDRAEVYR